MTTMTPSKFQTLSLLIYISQCFCATSVPVVNTTIGQIRGLVAEDGDYYMYMGIPYAQVDRLNPFGKALPQEPFDDVFDAIDDSAICPQIEEFNKTVVGSLDCLHLNIYAPTTATTADPKPVMVMIYGGGFHYGFAGRYVYGPKFLVRHDVIYVTLNYRLGPYGFACLDIPEIPGNQGLKDQALALRWINENIQQFGGDPNKITAFGNSAGGVSVDFHLLSQHEKLFHQAIIQSGSTLSPAFFKPNKNALLQLAAHLGVATNDIKEAVAFLAEIDEYSIVSASATLNLAFSPCVEKKFDNVESFITEDWTRAPVPKANAMPILLGITKHEEIAWIKQPAEFFENFSFLDILNNWFQITEPNFEGMDQLVHRFYMGDKKITKVQALAVVDFLSDFTFKHPMYQTVGKLLSSGAGAIFYYMFSYLGRRNFTRRLNNVTVGGAAHADELGYLYDLSFYEPPNIEDQLFIDRMTKLWTNFAKFGNPTPQPSELLPILWEPITNDSAFHYLDLDTQLTCGTMPFYRRMAFWDLFYEANADLLRNISG